MSKPLHRIDVYSIAGEHDRHAYLQVTRIHTGELVRIKLGCLDHTPGLEIEADDIPILKRVFNGTL